MKKKMTISEFEKWSRFASSLRDKAIAGEVDFAQYYADIRKQLFFVYRDADFEYVTISLFMCSF